MKPRCPSIARRAFGDESGQSIAWVVLAMGILLGMAAFVIDIGHAYFCYRELQAATDAAALAGAQNLRSSSATAIATEYSAVSGDKNTYANLSNVTMVSGYPLFECLTTLKNMGVACVSPNDANAIQVKEKATISTFFARIFGISTMTISATSTASVTTRAAPYNVAILIDTTESMNTYDSNCGNTRIACALTATQVLLADLDPCPPSAGTCTVSNGVAQNALDQVSVFTFPNVTTATSDDDYNCSGANPTSVAYTLPTYNSTSYDPTGSSTGTYQITPFLSDYRTSDTATSLDTSSDVSMAIGAGMKNGKDCSGMEAPGGEGTYYAGVIYAAQSALTAQYNAEGGSSANPVPQNIMIILTDGEANASSSKMNSKSNSSWNNGGSYPSAVDQCQQAVAAADYAKSQGTTVYSVGYGSESSGCTTDTTNAPGVNEAGITPCQVMAQMASSASTFYSDYNQSGSNSDCVSTGTSVVDLNDIFSSIAADFMNARLIPDNTQ